MQCTGGEIVTGMHLYSKFTTHFNPIVNAVIG